MKFLNLKTGIISTLILLIFSLIFFLSKKEDDLAYPPPEGEYTILISIEHSGYSGNITEFIHRLVNLEGEYYNKPALTYIERKGVTIVRLNRHLEDPTFDRVAELINRRINDYNLSNQVQYAIMTSDGIMITTGGFSINVFR